MPTYNVTQIAKVNSTMEFLVNVNRDIMRGVFGDMVVILIGIITFIAFVRATNQPVQAIAGAGFVTFTFGLLFYMMGLGSVWLVWVGLVAAALGVSFWNLD